MQTKFKSVLFMPRGIILLLGLLFLISCSRKETESQITPQARVYFDLFDTVSYVYSYKGDSEEEFIENADEVYSVLLKYHRLFDIYHEYEGINNLCTINSNPLCDITVEDELIEFLLYAKRMAEVTDGEMDVMMGSVLSLWHDARYSETPYLPSNEALENAAEYIGFDYLEINEEKKTVKLLSSSSSIDPGALGKGYATEKAAKKLEEKGVSSYVLNIGGNIRIIGSKVDGSGWRTGIKDPKDPENSFIVMLSLKDTSCVTSGNYERYFTLDGVKYSHIIDKDTLYPSQYYDSISIIVKDSALADALSTALFTTDYEEGKRLALSLGADAIWVFRDGSVRYTDGIEDLIIN